MKPSLSSLLAMTGLLQDSSTEDHCLFAPPSLVGAWANDGVRRRPRASYAEDRLGTINSGGSYTETGGGTPTNRSTWTRQVCALQPCEKEDAPRSSVSELGFALLSKPS